MLSISRSYCQTRLPLLNSMVLDDDISEISQDGGADQDARYDDCFGYLNCPTPFCTIIRIQILK